MALDNLFYKNHTVFNVSDKELKITKNYKYIRRLRVSILPLKTFDKRRIKRIRNKLNLSQPDFAAALGVSRKTIEAWESGRNRPSGSALRILQLLENDPSFFETNGIISIKKDS